MGMATKKEPMKDAAKDKKLEEGEVELQVNEPNAGATMGDISEDMELDESVEKDLMQAIRALAADRAGTPEEDLKAAIKIMVDREIRRSSPEHQDKLKSYVASKKGPQLEEVEEDKKPKPTSMDDLHIEIENMLNDGKSLDEIVLELGVSKDDVDGVKQDMKTAEQGPLKEAIRKRFARLIK